MAEASLPAGSSASASRVQAGAKMATEQPRSYVILIACNATARYSDKLPTRHRRYKTTTYFNFHVYLKFKPLSDFKYSLLTKDICVPINSSFDA